MIKKYIIYKLYNLICTATRNDLKPPETECETDLGMLMSAETSAEVTLYCEGCACTQILVNSRTACLQRLFNDV